MTESTGTRPEIAYWHLWTDARRRQPPDPVRADRVRAQGRRRRRSAVEQQAGAVRGDGRLHRAARRLGRRLAREPGAAMDRRAVRPLVDRIHGRHAHRAGARRVLFRRGPGLQPHGRTQRPPLRDHRRRAGRADDGAVACSPQAPSLPFHVDGRVRNPGPALPALRVAECAAGEARRRICLAGRPGLVRGPGLPAGQRSSERPDPALDSRWRDVGVSPPLRLRQRSYPRPGGPADRLLAPRSLHHAHRTGRPHHRAGRPIRRASA